jgi:hypothetical protein
MNKNDPRKATQLFIGFVADEFHQVYSDPHRCNA